MSDLQDRIAYQQALELRLSQVRDAIEVEAAMRDGAAFRMLVDAMSREEARALLDLVHCNPSDVGMISQLQAQARIAQVMRDSIQGILDRGRYAEKSLQDEDTGRG